VSCCSFVPASEVQIGDDMKPKSEDTVRIDRLGLAASKPHVLAASDRGGALRPVLVRSAR
jgi:hypothetical protein